MRPTRPSRPVELADIAGLADPLAASFLGMVIGERRNCRTARAGRAQGRWAPEGVGECCWCGVVALAGELTQEHLLPLGWGGTHAHENLRLACRPCNMRWGVVQQEIERRLGVAPEEPLPVDGQGWRLVRA